MPSLNTGLLFVHGYKIAIKMDLYGPALISIYLVKYFLLLQILDFFL